MSRCCHIDYLMHDVDIAMCITSILESLLKYVRCSENLNMQFSECLIVQPYIDTFVYFLPG